MRQRPSRPSIVKHPLEHLVLEIEHPLARSAAPGRPPAPAPAACSRSKARASSSVSSSAASRRSSCIGRAPDSSAEEDAPELRLSSIGTLPSLPLRYCSVSRSALAKAVIDAGIGDEGLPALLVVPLELAQILHDHPQLARRCPPAARRRPPASPCASAPGIPRAAAAPDAGRACLSVRRGSSAPIARLMMTRSQRSCVSMCRAGRHRNTLSSSRFRSRSRKSLFVSVFAQGRGVEELRLRARLRQHRLALLLGHVDERLALTAHHALEVVAERFHHLEQRPPACSPCAVGRRRHDRMREHQHVAHA